MSREIGNWMQTYTGKKFWPLDPEPEDVDIRDIAHALSLICRFNGHTPFHYSVAQHCLLCADIAREHRYARFPGFVLATLFHDAHEAYLVDVPRPVKPFMLLAPYIPGEGLESPAHYSYWAGRVQDAIFEAIGLKPDQVAAWYPEIKRIDNTVLATEGAHLMRANLAEWNLLEEPIPSLAIMQMDPETAERIFIKRSNELILEYLARKEGESK